MADITASKIYPSIKYISTDSKGDLQEILGTDATTASGTIQGITITSVATGASANGLLSVYKMPWKKQIMYQLMTKLSLLLLIQLLIISLMKHQR